MNNADKSIIIGVDPGFTGAIAAYNVNTGALDIIDMPTFTRNKKKLVNGYAVAEFLKSLGDDGVFGWIEQVTLRLR